MLHGGWADAVLRGFLAHPGLSLVLRPWIQDIEGANARELCNTSSSKGRTSVPRGKVPRQRVEERWGSSVPRRLLQPLLCVNAFPHFLTPLALQAGPWQVRPPVPEVPRVAVTA